MDRVLIEFLYFLYCNGGGMAGSFELYRYYLM